MKQVQLRLSKVWQQKVFNFEVVFVSGVIFVSEVFFTFKVVFIFNVVFILFNVHTWRFCFCQLLKILSHHASCIILSLNMYLKTSKIQIISKIKTTSKMKQVQLMLCKLGQGKVFKMRLPSILRLSLFLMSPLLLKSSSFLRLSLSYLAFTLDGFLLISFKRIIMIFFPQDENFRRIK